MAGNHLNIDVHEVLYVRNVQLFRSKLIMTTMTTLEARKHFADTLNRTAYGKERIVVTRRGQELAAILPIEDLRLLEEIEDQIDLREALRALKEPGEISLESLKKELGL